MRNQTMYRTCLLAAALLLTGCSEPKRDPLAVGSEVFLDVNGSYDLLHSPPPDQEPIGVTEGTKVRIVMWIDSHVKSGKFYPGTLEVLVLEGRHTGKLLKIKPNHVFFAP
jgi:hypothetical protein